MMAIDLVSGKKYFFIDLCLPFEASISCSHFQRISNALKHITEWKARRFNALSNYLDDFIFLTLSKITCNAFVKVFLEVCRLVNFPISSEKTEYATELIVFLGMLLDGRRKLVAVPEAKRLKALHLIRIFIQKKKAKVKEIQQLAGLLNFLNRAIIPGRVFMRRMYNKYSQVANKSSCLLKPYHHVNLDAEFRNDCNVWETFLSTRITEVLNRPFTDWDETASVQDLSFFTDASKNEVLGFGCILGDRWTNVQWEPGYIRKFDPSIEYLELYALCVGVFTWRKHLRNIRLLVHCDNQSVVEMINSSSSQCWNCMNLLRLLTLNSLRSNTRIFAQHIFSKDNYLSNCLSRMKMKQFFEAAPVTMQSTPDTLPADLWPASKLWVA